MIATQGVRKPRSRCSLRDRESPRVLPEAWLLQDVLEPGRPDEVANQRTSRARRISAPLAGSAATRARAHVNRAGRDVRVFRNWLPG